MHARPRVFVRVALSAFIGTVAGCPPENSSIPGVDNQSTPPAEPIVSRPDAAAPAGPAPSVIAGDVTLLNEVRFLPRADAFAFVELKIGVQGPAPAAVTLENETGARIELPSGVNDPGPAGLTLIQFDGADFVEPGIVHARPTDFLNTTAGSVKLLDAAGRVLDQVAWGAEFDNRVPLNRGGGIGDDEPAPGIVLVRYADSVATEAIAWAALPPNWSTPGSPNPSPGVTMLLPMSGAIVPSGSRQLSWYPEPHAVSYDVEIATVDTFDALFLQSNVAEPVIIVSLPANQYFWRVRTRSPSGAVSDWSSASILYVEEPENVESGTAKRMTHAQATGNAVRSGIPGFPTISQHKDSPMLLLESLRTDRDHAWDSAHAVLNAADPADNMNCTLASVQMVNAFFNGNLTQDRIGFELHRNDQRGPERDLNYGSGNLPDRALKYALGGRVIPGTRINRETYLDFWVAMKDAIDDQRPVVVVVTSDSNGSHTEVIVGYEIDLSVRPPRFSVVVEDPWWPGSATSFNYAIEFSAFTAALFSYYVIPSGVVGTKLEPELSAQPPPDTDGDGIIDFDEKNRFGTRWQNNPQDRDSDGDCRRDKDEIHWSMLDPKWGYAVASNYSWVGHSRLRQLVLSSSGVPISGRPELDVDGDGDGLPDFAEDLNFNGQRESDGSESNPFSMVNDARGLVGTYTEKRHLKFPVDGATNPGDTDWEQSDLLVDATYDLHVQADGTLSGTANVTHRASVASHSIPSAGQDCNPIEYHIVDRSWTNTVTGTWSCDNTSGGRVLLRLRYGDEGLAVPFSIIDGCSNTAYTGNNSWFQQVAPAGVCTWNRERKSFWFESVFPLTDRQYDSDSESYARLELTWK